MKLPSVLFKGLTNWGRDPINADFYPDGDSLQFLATYKVCSGASAPADGDADFKHQVEYGSGTFTTETATVIPLKSINYKDYHNGAPSLVRTRKNAQRRNFIVKKNFPLFHQVDRVDEQFDSSLIAVLHRFDDATTNTTVEIWRNTAHHIKIKIALPSSDKVTKRGLPFNGDIQVTITNDNFASGQVVEFCGFAIAKVGKNIPCVHPVKDMIQVPIGSVDEANTTEGDYHKRHNSVKISGLCYMQTVDDPEEDKVWPTKGGRAYE